MEIITSLKQAEKDVINAQASIRELRTSEEQDWNNIMQNFENLKIQESQNAFMNSPTSERALYTKEEGQDWQSLMMSWERLKQQNEFLKLDAAHTQATEAFEAEENEAFRALQREYAFFIKMTPHLNELYESFNLTTYEEHLERNGVTKFAEQEHARALANYNERIKQEHWARIAFITQVEAQYDNEWNTISAKLEEIYKNFKHAALAKEKERIKQEIARKWQEIKDPQERRVTPSKASPGPNKAYLARKLREETSRLNLK